MASVIENVVIDVLDAYAQAVLPTLPDTKTTEN